MAVDPNVQALCDSAYDGDLEGVERALKSVKDPNQHDKDGFTALHRASVIGDIDIIKVLVATGADVNAEDVFGDSPLHYACFCGHYDVVEYLIDCGGDALRPSRDGKTALDSAREENHEEIVKLVTEQAMRISGLDLTTGVAIEGFLKKKKVKGVMTWKRRYFVLSSKYDALYFWAGSKHSVEGVIKKIRLESLFSVTHHPDKKNGRRFDVRVASGRSMCLLANIPQVAEDWMDNLTAFGARFMAAHRIQAMYRGYTARCSFATLKKNTTKRTHHYLSADILADCVDGILMEGVLKKKNASTIAGRHTWGARYFVIDIKAANLVYYDSKAKRLVGKDSTSIPFSTFLQVANVMDKQGKHGRRRINLSVTGRMYSLLAQDEAEAESWVNAFKRILPRENDAAVKMQSLFRGYVARKNYVILKSECDEEARQEREHDLKVLKAATLRIQAIWRGKSVSKKIKAKLELRRNYKRYCARVCARRWKRVVAERRRQHEILNSWEKATDDDDKEFWYNTITEASEWEMPAEIKAEWRLTTDEETGRKYWFNAIADESAWEKPEGLVDEWQEYNDKASGQVYFVNKYTGDSRWTRPWQLDWEEHVDEDGDKFYVNKETEESSWEKPVDEEGDDNDLEDGWQTMYDKKSNKEYYFNPTNDETTWVKPTKQTTLPEDILEASFFAGFINTLLKDDETEQMQKLLPLPTSFFRSTVNHLVSICEDGILLCRLINVVEPDTVDMRVVNLDSTGNSEERQQNINLLIGAARSIGCVINDEKELFLREHSNATLDLIWQILKMRLVKMASLRNHPELVQLCGNDEEITELLHMPMEALVLRWVNYHMKNVENETVVENFGSQLKDSGVYFSLLKSIASREKPDHEIDEDGGSRMDRAISVLEHCDALGIPSFAAPEVIVHGNTRLNLALCCLILDTRAGMEDPALIEMREEERKAEQERINSLRQQLEKGMADEKDSREERVFRMWINSLNLEGVYITNLFDSLQDGLVILRIMDFIEQGIVEWKRANKKPNNPYKKIENCNYVIELCKALELTLINVGGLDIMYGNRKLVLALLWQLMRSHTLKILSGLANEGFEIDEDNIIEWANEMTMSIDSELYLESFRDDELGNGLFLIDMLEAAFPGSVDRNMVLPGETEDDCMYNARYVINVARKVGVGIFITWEDLVEVKPKMIMIFVASVMSRHHESDN